MADNELELLFNSIRALPEGGAIRILSTPYGIYVLRDRPDEVFKKEITYFSEGEWHLTLEGVSFSEIEPWIKASVPPHVPRQTA